MIYNIIFHILNYLIYIIYNYYNNNNNNNNIILNITIYCMRCYEVRNILWRDVYTRISNSYNYNIIIYKLLYVPTISCNHYIMFIIIVAGFIITFI